VDGTAFPSDVITAAEGDLSSASEELRLAGSLQNLHWMLGGNYQREVANQFNSFILYTTNTIVPGPASVNRAAEVIDQQTDHTRRLCEPRLFADADAHRPSIPRATPVNGAHSRGVWPTPAQVPV